MKNKPIKAILTAGFMLVVFNISVVAQDDAEAVRRFRASATSPVGNFVKNTDILVNSIKGNRLKDGTVNGAKLIDGTVTAAKLEPSIGIWSAFDGNLLRATGTVGIGTTTPGFRLSVLDSILSRGSVSNSSNGISFQNFSGNERAFLGIAGISSGIVFNTVPGDLALRSNTGNVVIGTGNSGTSTLINGDATIEANASIGGTVHATGAGLNTNTFAFIHTTTAQNIGQVDTIIDNPQCNDDANAILFVTHNAGGPSFRPVNPKAIGVYFDGAKWRIQNVDNSGPPVIGSAYNVMVIKP